MDEGKVLLINLFNTMFTTFQKKKIKNLKELTNEKTLKALVLEIEPTIEKSSGKIEITDDNSFGIRYANFVSIFNCLEEYFEKCPENYRFTYKVSIKQLIVINNLLKGEDDQLIALAEIILVLSAISAKKEYWLDHLGEQDSVHVGVYLEHVEKYIQVDTKNGEDSFINSRLDLNKSALGHFEKDRQYFIITIEKLEKEKDSLEKKYAKLEIQYKELSFKYKDFEMEAETLKKNNLNSEEDLKNYNYELSEKLMKKDLEIEELKKDNENKVFRLNEEIVKFKEKISYYEDNYQEYKSIKNENDKLKQRMKDSTAIKDKHTFSDSNSLEIKNKQVENLIKEKQGLLAQIDKLTKELYAERDKNKSLTQDKNKIENENGQLKKGMINLDFPGINNISDIKRMVSANYSEAINFNDIEKDSMFFELENAGKAKEQLLIEKKNSIERDYMNEIAEIHKHYKCLSEQNQKLIEEKEALVNELDDKKFIIGKYNTEKEKLVLENQKLDLKVQKNDLVYEKMAMNVEKLENEKKKLEEEIKENSQKVTKVSNEKTQATKELESLRSQLVTNTNYIDRLVTEKKAIGAELEKVKEELAKLSAGSGSSGTNKATNSVNSANVKSVAKNSLKSSQTLEKSADPSSNNEVNNLKIELSNLKNTLIHKEDSIKVLKEKVQKLEIDLKNSNSALQEKTEKLNSDLSKRTEDMEFYKRTFDEQKVRVNREHELITSSLYELALQFMSFKNELQNKVNQNESMK